MLRVMVADDESILRKGLISFVHWGDLGCVVECEAHDGLDAVEKLKTHHVDLAIIDIQMPGMNGLDLCRHISEHYPLVKKVILTGYSDFSYAQQAIQLGVEDYIIKSSPIEQIEESIKVVVKKLFAENERKEYYSSIENAASSYRYQQLEKKLSEILLGKESDGGEIKLCLDELGMRITNYVVILCALYEQGEITSSDSLSAEERAVRLPEAISLLKSSILNSLSNCTQHSFSLDPYCFALVVDIQGADAWSAEKMLKASRTMAEKANQMPLNASVGISLPHSDSRELPSAFCEANQAMISNFYSDSFVSVYAADIQQPPAEEMIQKQNFDESLMQNIVNYLGETHPFFEEGLLSSVFDDYRKKRISPEHIKSDCLSLVLFCWQLVYHNGNLQLADSLLSSAVKSIQTIRTINELQIFMGGFLKTISGYLNKKANKHSPLINEINGFIRANYMRDLKLSDFEKRFHINKNYLSQLYKKETGMGLMKAITQYRMELAKIALLDPSRKLMDVSMSVGIEDLSYFIQVFKKATGMTPGQFRQQAAEER